MKKVWVVAGVVLLWQLVHIFLFPNGKIPSPIEVGIAFYDLVISGELLSHVFSSLKRVSIGFLRATITGVALAMFFGYFQKAGRYIEVLVELIRPIPPIAWIPIAILLFGIGDSSSYFIVFLGAFFPIFTNAYFGVRSIPEIYKNTAMSFEITGGKFIKKILFYYSLPYIFTGLKIGIGMAWMSVIAAELIGAQDGLGYFIQISRLMLQTENVIAGMLSIGLVGLLLNFVLIRIERMVIPWQKK